MRREITPRVFEQVILGVKHLPADVTGIATLLMNLLGFVLTDCFTDITGQVPEGLIVLTHVTIVSIYDRGRHRVTAVITGYCHPVHDTEGIVNTGKSLSRWSWNNEMLEQATSLV